MEKILIIDDDVNLCELLGDCLGLEGFDCDFAHNGPDGMERLQTGLWDLLVLDIMLPWCSGFDVLRFIRRNSSTARLPVLMLTAKSAEMDRISGLESGADDYLTKPFSCRELAARIRAILRRAERSLAQTAGAQPSSVTLLGDLHMNSATMRITVRDEIVPITPLEFHLLEILVKNSGQVISRELLSQEVLGHNLNPAERTIDVHVSRIRSKLGNYADGSQRIRAVRGEGYVYLQQEKA